MSEVSGRHDEIQGAILHEYDGIEEADNQLPLWWVLGFLFTIAFGLAYWIGFEVLQARPSPAQEYEQAKAEIAAVRAAQAASMGEVTAEALTTFAADPVTVTTGKALFTQYCVACHGERAEGKIGPNLTDGAWIHGGKPMDVYKTVTEGVTAKGMPPWLPVLGPKSVREVVAFVLSIRDTNVPGKPPEGEPVAKD